MEEVIRTESGQSGEEKAFVYMIKCRDGSLYTGITKDLAQRMKDHYGKTEKAAKYTKSRGIREIMMVWEVDSYRAAARLEYAIKRLTREKKLQLIARPEEKLRAFFPKLSEEVYLPRREYKMEITKFLRTI